MKAQLNGRLFFFLGLCVFALVFGIFLAPKTTQLSLSALTGGTDTAILDAALSGDIQQLDTLESQTAKLKQALNPAFLCVLGIMGLLPAYFSSVVLFEEDTKKRFAYWLACIVGLVIGPIAILPLIGVFGRVRSRVRPPGKMYAYLDSHGHAVVIAVLAVLTVWVGIEGDWKLLMRQFRTDAVVRAVTLNTLIGLAGYAVLMDEDNAERAFCPGPLLTALFRIPLVGATIQLYVRPQLNVAGTHGRRPTLTWMR